MSKSAGSNPWVLLLLWTGVILVADGALVSTTWRQHLAAQYPSVQGKIAQSALGQGAIIRRGLVIRYTYKVDGTNYTGSRFRYDDHNSTIRWMAALNAFPAHAKRPVYYNPANPHDSVLSPGVDGCDLLLLLATMPLNAATLAIWAGILGPKLVRRRDGETGGVEIVQRNDETLVRLAEMPAFAAGLLAFGTMAFLSASGLVFIRGFDVSPELVAQFWGLTALVGAAVWIWRAVRNNSGNYDLRINGLLQTVTLPQTAGRAAPVTVPMGEVLGVSVQRRVSRIPSGSHYSYLPALNRAAPGEGAQPAPLVRWGWNEPKARAFGEWLSRQLRIDFKGIEDEQLEPAGKP